MTRQALLDSLSEDFDSGRFFEVLARRIAFRTESQVQESFPHLRAYLVDEIGPELDSMGYEQHLIDNPVPGGGPFLIGRRIEDPSLPTVLTYGHGDVIRGLEGSWADGRDPWTLEAVGERVYGRGVADNKGQHCINLRALRAVLETRGRLGFNSIIFLETSEEIGSPGIHEFCAAHRDLLSADLLIASDGPRLAYDRPTLFMGTRGALNFELSLELREGGHHSGNWGGLLSNPAIIIANAIASIADQNGRVKVPGLMPERIPNSVRAALAGVEIQPSASEPEIDPNWGEPGLTPAERVYGWNTFGCRSRTDRSVKSPYRKDDNVVGRYDRLGIGLRDKPPSGIESPTLYERAEGQDGLTTLVAPAHPRAFHALRHQRLARRLNDA